MSNTLVTNLQEYLTSVYAITKRVKADNKYRVYYRGEPGTFPIPMVPAIFRVKEDNAEKQHYQRALRHHPEEFSKSSNIDIISKMQHYRYPTRMLDFTVNSLVALFFACGGDSKAEGTFKKNGDGHVHIYFADVAKDVLSFDSDRALLVSVLPRFTSNEHKIIKKIFEDADSENKRVTNEWIKRYDEKSEESIQFGRYIHQVRIERPGFEQHRIEPKDILKGYFVKPNFSTSRIKNQAGLFAIFGLGENDFKHAFKVKEEINYFDITIDSSYFDHILAELDFYCNIGFSTLFDDLESTAKAHKQDLYKVWRDNNGTN
jgi:hypothetical protein